VNTGFEFETTDEKTDENENSTYWTREELMKHLENNPRPDEDICGEESGNYDERILKMEELVKDGVYKRIIKPGFGDVITEDSAVLYNLNAFLEGQDEPFDSTWLRGKPYLHKLNYDTVLEGLCRGLLTMRRGERCELIVRPKYAYLEMGCPPRVPPNATVLYIVEVIKIFEEGTLAHFETLSFEERDKVSFQQILKLCDSERISGNSFYVQKKFKESAFRFRRAIRCLEQLTYKSVEDEKASKALLLKLYVNIANTYNKIQKPLSAMTNCKEALKIDSNNVKALYQYGLAKMINGDYEASQRLLKQANGLKPNDKYIMTALTKLDQRMTSDNLVLEQMYRSMGSVFK
jgi:FK506-binding protein 6